MKGVFLNTQDYTLCYNILKKAYLMKFQNINSEDKPEEFMQLRLAYEKALEQADSQGEIINNLIPKYVNFMFELENIKINKGEKLKGSLKLKNTNI